MVGQWAAKEDSWVDLRVAKALQTAVQWVASTDEESGRLAVMKAAMWVVKALQIDDVWVAATAG